MTFDGTAFGAEIVAAVKSHVQDVLTPIASRLDEIERRLDGRTNQSVTGVDVSVTDEGKSMVISFTVGDVEHSFEIGLPEGPAGKDGEPGKDGADGLGFEHMSVEQLNERTLRFLFKRDADEAEVDVTFPVPIYRGVFKESAEYETGDLTTWAGSLWHCNEPKGLKPGVPDSGWQLAAKAGRPGKDK